MNPQGYFNHVKNLGKLPNFSPTADGPRRKPRELEHFEEPSDKLTFHIALLNPVPHIVVAGSSRLGFTKASATSAFFANSVGPVH
jgi:hypothetical protein